MGRRMDLAVAIVMSCITTGMHCIATLREA